MSSMHLCENVVVKIIASNIFFYFSVISTFFNTFFYRPVLRHAIFLFYIGFRQGGNLGVFCYRKLEGKTSMAISTTSASSTTRLSSPSSVVSFTELIATSAINKKKSSEELKCDHRSGIFLSIYDKEMIIIVSFTRRFS